MKFVTNTSYPKCLTAQHKDFVSNLWPIAFPDILQCDNVVFQAIALQTSMMKYSGDNEEDLYIEVFYDENKENGD